MKHQYAFDVILKDGRHCTLFCESEKMYEEKELKKINKKRLKKHFDCHQATINEPTIELQTNVDKIVDVVYMGMIVY